MSRRRDRFAPLYLLAGAFAWAAVVAAAALPFDARNPQYSPLAPIYLAVGVAPSAVALVAGWMNLRWPRVALLLYGVATVYFVIAFVALLFLSLFVLPSLALQVWAGAYLRRRVSASGLGGSPPEPPARERGAC
jgi:hypothetical protein